MAEASVAVYGAAIGVAIAAAVVMFARSFGRNT